MMNPGLVNDLKYFGLNDYEAKAYLALSVYGPSTAALISSKSRIPQSKIYDTLKRLKNRSLVEIWKSRPQRFKAIDPSNALNSIIVENTKKIDNLRKKTRSIVRNIKPKNGDESDIWVCKGKKVFLRKISETIPKCKGEILFITSSFPRKMELDEAVSKIMGRADVNIVGICRLTESLKSKASWYAKKGAKVRIIEADLKQEIVVVDDYVFMRLKESEFIYSKSPVLSEIVRAYFKSLWGQGSMLSV